MATGKCKIQHFPCNDFHHTYNVWSILYYVSDDTTNLLIIVLDTNPVWWGQNEPAARKQVILYYRSVYFMVRPLRAEAGSMSLRLNVFFNLS